MNQTAQYKKFIARSTSLLRQAGQWIDVNLEGFEGSLDTTDENLLRISYLLLKKIGEVLQKLHEWLEQNSESNYYSKVVFLVGGLKKLTNSWASQNISK